MSFSDPISRRELEPRRLPRATRDFKRQARARGLLGHGAADSGAGMEPRVAALLKAVRAGGALNTKQRLQIGAAAAWLHAKERGQDLGVLRESVVLGRVQPLARDWWVLVCLFFQNPEVREQLERSLPSWGARSRKRFETRAAGLSPKKLAALPDVLATRVVTLGTRLDDVTNVLQVPAGCPLEGEVWARLLSIQASPWMTSQPFSLVDAQLERRRGHWSVGSIGRQLLEPVFEAGATPEDVAPDREFAQVVASVARRMPRQKDHQAWERLGSGGAELIRWWKTQRDLEEFFSQWDADPEREAFWRRYVRHIRAVEPHRTASALAMAIGDFWFVEFGKPGNACYAYRAQDWAAARSQRKRARSERDLKKNVPCDLRRKKNHMPAGGWQWTFRSWVQSLSGKWV